MNCAIDVKGPGGRKRTDADARALELQVFQLGRAGVGRRLRRAVIPLAIIEDMEGRLVLNDFQRAALAQRNARLLKGADTCFYRVASRAGTCVAGR